MKTQDIQRQKFLKEVATIYAKMVEPIEGETYSETAKRLSLEVGERIQPKVFYMAVKLIRSKGI